MFFTHVKFSIFANHVCFLKSSRWKHFIPRMESLAKLATPLPSPRYQAEAQQAARGPVRRASHSGKVCLSLVSLAGDGPRAAGRRSISRAKRGRALEVPVDVTEQVRKSWEETGDHCQKTARRMVGAWDKGASGRRPEGREMGVATPPPLRV